jgi:hypothetical protein
MTDLLMARANFLVRADWTKETASYVAVNNIDLEAVNAYAGTIVVLNCQFFGNGHFDFNDDEGKPGVVIEVYAEDDETTIDFCAWPIDNPGGFATLLGAAEALGMARVTNPATWAFGGVLNVHRMPLTWLQAGCGGCCILRHRYVSAWLGGALGAIQAEDVDHARQLDRWLNPPRFDRCRILVPGSAAIRRSA